MRTRQASGFYICDGKGFHITFANGWTLSVQFGPGNYCDHYDRRIGRDETECGKVGSSTAECAIISPSGNLIEIDGPDGDTVRGRCTPADVAELVRIVSEKKEE